MRRGNQLLWVAFLAATALSGPQCAAAQTTGEQTLEARLAQLEAQMAQLRSELASAREQQTATATAAQGAQLQARETTTRVAALEARPLPEGFRVGNTTVRIGGFIKLTAAHSRFSDGEVVTNTFGRDFDLPQAVPTGGAPASSVQDFSAKQTRLWLNLASDVGGHTLKGYVEADFQTAPGTQGSQRTTNGYDLSLRRAYVQFDKWTIGQDWSTFQNVAVLPESTDFVGATAGTVFVREPLIRYTTPIGAKLTLAVSLENAESGTAMIGNAAAVENGDDRLPDLTARINYQGTRAELAIAGVARQLSVQTGAAKDTRFGWGVSASGKIFLDSGKTSDIRFMATYGSGIGRYIGLNFAPDALVNSATGELSRVDVVAALAALRLAIAPDVRINLIADYQSVDYPGGLTPVEIGMFNRRTYSGAVNLFYTPFKGIDLGIEYRHRVRDLESGASGSLDRLEFAAKYSF